MKNHLDFRNSRARPATPSRVPVCGTESHRSDAIPTACIRPHGSIMSPVVNEIFAALKTEVDQAREEYTRAKRDFWHISAEVPTGFPHPDGMQRIANASRAQTAAMVAYTRALRRFNEFLLNGTVPEDLKKPGETASKARGSGNA